MARKFLSGFMPDIGKLQGMFTEKFDQLIAKLDEMLVVQREIRDELRIQRGASQ